MQLTHAVLYLTWRVAIGARIVGISVLYHLVWWLS